MEYGLVVTDQFSADVSGKQFHVVASPVVRALAHQTVGSLCVAHLVGYKGVENDIWVNTYKHSALPIPTRIGNHSRRLEPKADSWLQCFDGVMQNTYKEENRMNIYHLGNSNVSVNNDRGGR